MTVSNGTDSAPAFTRSGSKAWFKNFFSFFLTFALMLASWLVLSGKFEPLLLILGVVSSFMTAYFFHDLLFPVFEGRFVGICFRFLIYIPWVVWEIVKANFHVLYLAFHPRMDELIDPHIIVFRTKLKSPIAITTLANSITLTPGTITISATRDGVFTVHAIDRPSSDALPGTMLEKVAKVFGEDI